LVYKWTKEGIVMVDRESPANPQTSAQLAVRGAFKKATQQWKTMTEAQIEAWNEYAKERSETEEITNRKYRLSGFNWFARFAARYFAVNPSATSAPTAPPASDFAGDTITITAEPAETAGGGITFTASAPNSTNVTTALLVQKLVNANRKPMPGGYRTKLYFKFVSGTLQKTISLPPGYYAVGYEFVNMATGQESSRVLLGKVGPVSLAVSTPKSAKKAA
jgi:hypothetical protein